MPRPKRSKTNIPFGKNLKTIMKERGLTHREVAEMASCPISVVNDWCGANASTPHDLMRVSRLASALGVSFQWLLLGEGARSFEKTILQAFDFVSDDSLSGYFKIEVKKLNFKDTK